MLQWVERHWSRLSLSHEASAGDLFCRAVSAESAVPYHYCYLLPSTGWTNWVLEHAFHVADSRCDLFR